MKPQKNSYTVRIPLTFDGVFRNKVLNKNRYFVSLSLFLFWILLSIFSLIFGEIIVKLLFPPISFVILTLIIRFLILNEFYYAEKKQELEDNEYYYNTNTFWGIYEILPQYPYMCKYSNGLKSVFVLLEKDVVVGKDSDNEYNHYEAVAEVYRLVSKANIEMIHIDYMDTIGKDNRVSKLYDSVNETKNKDLKNLMTRIYDNVEQVMATTYASYDVYCFMSYGKEDLFWDEVQSILGVFRLANYKNVKLLNKQGIGELTKNLMNLEKFSVNIAIEDLFSSNLATLYIRPISVENNGVVTKLNNTLEEINAIKNVNQTEREFRKNAKKDKSKKDKYSKLVQEIEENEDIDLFS